MRKLAYISASLGLLLGLIGCTVSGEGAEVAAVSLPTAIPTATATTQSTPLPPASATPKPTTVPTATPELGFYPPPGREFATLGDFWNGRAQWLLEIADTGLPIGESDTVYRGGTELWSYLHASDQSAGVVDQCGDPVAFPGCTTRWVSHDAGQSFALEEPVCLFACDSCPCEHLRDQIDQQQYPRVFFADDEAYLVYEFGAYNFLRTSSDGITWSDKAHIEGTWIWTYPYGGCAPYELIGFHPNIYSSQEWDCLAGGPPGIYIEGDMLYVFVGLGKAPGHMGCYKGNRYEGAAGMVECDNNPLFSANEYGPVELLGADANPYFDFRTISSADVVRVGDHYYMTYEGVRGPSDPTVVDNQFGLGLARSVSVTIDGPWEAYPDNPIIMDLPGNVGVGHADIVIIGEATYLYTATEAGKRGRYVLLKQD
jgi:hypothetical protein